jgi:hypothetical protein
MMRMKRSLNMKNIFVVLLTAKFMLGFSEIGFTSDIEDVPMKELTISPTENEIVSGRYSIRWRTDIQEYKDAVVDIYLKEWLLAENIPYTQGSYAWDTVPWSGYSGGEYTLDIWVYVKLNDVYVARDEVTGVAVNNWVKITSPTQNQIVSGVHTIAWETSLPQNLPYTVNIYLNDKPLAENVPYIPGRYEWDTIPWSDAEYTLYVMLVKDGEIIEGVQHASVRISVDHTMKVLSPTPGATLSGAHTIIWTTNVPADVENVFVSFYLSPGDIPIRTDIPHAQGIYVWNTVGILDRDYNLEARLERVVKTEMDRQIYRLDTRIISITIDNPKSEVDEDSDGVVEKGPTEDDPNYDGNGDGVPDGAQEHVISLPTFGEQEYVTFVSEIEDRVFPVDALQNPDPAQQYPEGTTKENFPYEFFGFNVSLPDNTTNVEIFLPAGAPVPTSYYKFGPTPDNPQPHWYEFMYDGATGAQIMLLNDGRTLIRLHFVDGERGDADSQKNRIVVDPGGPFVPVPKPPTPAPPKARTPGRIEGIVAYEGDSIRIVEINIRMKVYIIGPGGDILEYPWADITVKPNGHFTITDLPPVGGGVGYFVIAWWDLDDDGKLEIGEPLGFYDKDKDACVDIISHNAKDIYIGLRDALKIYRHTIKYLSPSSVVVELQGDGFEPYLAVWCAGTWWKDKRGIAKVKVLSDNKAVAVFEDLKRGEYTLYVAAYFKPGWGIFEEYYWKCPIKIAISEEKDAIEVCPNPAKNVSYITFSGLPSSCTITICTLTGQKVWSKKCNKFQVWDLKNQIGQDVASGVYIYVVRDVEGKVLKKGKICIIR